MTLRLSALLVFGMLGALVGVFTGATEIPRDVSSRMIAVLLSKPISRGRYLAGKYLGCLLISTGYTCLWLIIMLVARVVDGDSLSVWSTGIGELEQMLREGYIGHTVNKITFADQCYYVIDERFGEDLFAKRHFKDV